MYPTATHLYHRRPTNNPRRPTNNLGSHEVHRASCPFCHSCPFCLSCRLGRLSCRCRCRRQVRGRGQESEQWAVALLVRGRRRRRPTSSLDKEASQARALDRGQSVAPRVAALAPSLVASQVVALEVPQARALDRGQSVAPLVA